MTVRPFVNDALWRCLCPSYSPASLAASTLPRRANPRNLNSPARRCLSATTTRNDAFDDTNLPFNQSRPQRKSPNGAYSGYRNSRPGHANPRPPPLRYPSKDKDSPALVLLSTEELYDLLRKDAAAGRHAEVMNIIKILIKDRREKPNVRLYAAMLHSFVSPDAGTAGKIRKVLEEMAEAGVDLDAGGCHAVLEALAVHPDYLLRDEILAYMKSRWFTLTDRGHNMVVAGLLRDRLFEQAIQKIEDMGQQGIKVADWLLDMTIWILLDYKEIDEAWNLLLVRQQSGRSSISQPLWGQFLDTAARLGHSDSITPIWTNRVTPGYLKPPTGTCNLVLEHSARTGNIVLATDVFRIFAERDTPLTSLHYETLLQAYLNASDLNAALSIILIMKESAVKFDDAALFPLYIYLKEEKARPMQAFSLLQGFESAGRKVPTAAVNSCLKASVHLGDLEEAIEIYKALHTVSRAGPNTETFNILFQGCNRAGRKELAMFLAAEMIKLGVKPDALTYDRLVLVCCVVEDLDDAFAYFDEMRSQGMVPRRGTVDKLLGLGCEMGDRRVEGVLRDAEGLEVLGGSALKNWQRRIGEMVGRREELGLGVAGEGEGRSGGRVAWDKSPAPSVLAAAEIEASLPGFLVDEGKEGKEKYL